MRDAMVGEGVVVVCELSVLLRLLLALGSLLPGLGPLHVQDEIGVTVSVELVDGRLSVLSVGEVDECESSGLSGDAVLCEVDALAVSESREQILQISLGHLLAQVRDAHGVCVVAAQGLHGLGARASVQRHVLGAARRVHLGLVGHRRRQGRLVGERIDVLTLGALEGPVTSLTA